MYNFKTIYELLGEYSKKDINMAIKKLSLEEREIIILKYGKDLNKPMTHNNITFEQSECFHRSIVPKIKRIIEASKRKAKTIYEYFEGYKKEEVDEAIAHLSDEHRMIISKVCCSNLATRKSSSEYESEDIYKLHHQVIRRISRYLELGPTSRKIRSFYSHFPENTPKEIDLMISMLSPDDKELLKRRYGDNLAKPNVTMEWNREHQVKLWLLIKRIIPCMIERYNKNFYEYFPDYTEDEVDEVIKLLPEEMQKELPIKFDGFGASYYDKSRVYKILIRDIEFIQQKLKQINKRRKIKSIYELLNGFTKEEIDEVILGLNNEEKQLLYIRYGSDLENPVTSREWTQDMHKPFVRLIQKIRYTIETKNKTKNAVIIYDYFPDDSVERINALLAQLSFEDKELIYMKYGANLLKPQKSDNWNRELYNKFYCLINRIRTKNRKTKDIIELLSFEEDSEYQMIIAKYEKDVSLQTQEEVNCDDFVMWATNNLLLSALDQEIIVKRYQQNLEIEAIADMYDITPEIVLLNLKTLLNIYKREKLEQLKNIELDNGISRVLVPNQSLNEA